MGYKHKLRSFQSQAPIRLDFAGGPTDVDPFKSKEGGYIVNVAIKQFARVNIQERKNTSILIRSHDFNKEELYDSLDRIDLKGPLKLIKAAVKYIAPKTGIEIDTRIDVPSGSGLGTSAALSVALLGVLRAISGQKTTDLKKIAKEALFIENVMIKNINGGQDQYASALGGLHSFKFGRDTTQTKALKISKRVITELESRSVICYSGESHISGKELNKIMLGYSAGNKKTVGALRKMRELAHAVEKALVRGDFDKFGKLIEETGHIQKSFHRSIYPKKIVDILSVAFQNGALGGKLAGAGGGGALYLFSKKGKKTALTMALKNRNIHIIPAKFSENGLTVWENKN